MEATTEGKPMHETNTANGTTSEIEQGLAAAIRGEHAARQVGATEQQQLAMNDHQCAAQSYAGPRTLDDYPQYRVKSPANEAWGAGARCAYYKINSQF
jgi:hypothetical protein